MKTLIKLLIIEFTNHRNVKDTNKLESIINLLKVYNNYNYIILYYIFIHHCKNDGNILSSLSKLLDELKLNHDDKSKFIASLDNEKIYIHKYINHLVSFIKHYNIFTNYELKEMLSVLFFSYRWDYFDSHKNICDTILSEFKLNPFICDDGEETSLSDKIYINTFGSTEFDEEEMWLDYLKSFTSSYLIN